MFKFFVFEPLFIYLFFYLPVIRYEDDPIIGHRLYREIRHVEVKKMKARGPTSPPRVSYQWETVATNLDEFQEVSVSFCIINADDILSVCFGY